MCLIYLPQNGEITYWNAQNPSCVKSTPLRATALASGWCAFTISFIWFCFREFSPFCPQFLRRWDQYGQFLLCYLVSLFTNWNTKIIKLLKSDYNKRVTQGSICSSLFYENNEKELSEIMLLHRILISYEPHTYTRQPRVSGPVFQWAVKSCDLVTWSPHNDQL